MVERGGVGGGGVGVGVQDAIKPHSNNKFISRMPVSAYNVQVRPTVGSLHQSEMWRCRRRQDRAKDEMVKRKNQMFKHVRWGKKRR